MTFLQESIKYKVKHKKQTNLNCTRGRLDENFKCKSNHDTSSFSSFLFSNSLEKDKKCQMSLFK